MTWLRSTALISSLCLGCAPPPEPVAPSVYADATALNPTLDDGRLVYRTFGDHHPECFAFVADRRDTETVPCPDGALRLLESCPAGLLYPSDDPRGCVCVPEDGEASWTTCPR